MKNIGGLTPPSQTMLGSPANGEVIYDTSSDIVQSPQNVRLNWVQSSDATDYILYTKIKITSIHMIQDSMQQYQVTPSPQANSSPGEVYEWWS